MRCVEAPSLHPDASFPRIMAVGGFLCDFECIRTASGRSESTGESLRIRAVLDGARSGASRHHTDAVCASRDARDRRESTSRRRRRRRAAAVDAQPPRRSTPSAASATPGSRAATSRGRFAATARPSRSATATTTSQMKMRSGGCGRRLPRASSIGRCVI